MYKSYENVIESINNNIINSIIIAYTKESISRNDHPNMLLR